MSKNGYTLIEVLVTLTLVGLLFGFGFASFRDFSRRQHLTGVVRDVTGDLRLAQEKAISGEKPNDPGCIGLNTFSSYDFKVVSVSSYQIVVECTGGNVVAKTSNLPADVTIASSFNPIAFKVLGQGTNVPSGNDAVITLSLVGATTTQTVKVSSTGEIK